MKNSTKRVTQITRNKSKSPKKCSHNIGKQEKKNRKIETEETNRKHMEEQHSNNYLKCKWCKYTA